MRAWVTIAFCACAAACTAGDFSLEGKSCPCVVGWVCDDATDRCVRLSTVDSGLHVDGGRDAGLGEEDGGATDAAMMDAGATDSGARADGGVDGGGVDTACDGPLASAIFCDGFEDGPGLAAWTREPPTDGLVTWVDDVVYRGRGALRAETTAPSGEAYLHTATTPTVGAGDYWMRLYARFPASSPLVHFDLAAVAPSARMGGVTLYVLGGRPAIWLEEPMTGFSSMTSLPLDTWVCLELHTVVSDTAGVVEAYLEGALVRSTSGVDTRAVGPYDLLVVGLLYTDTDQPATVIYVDEIAVGTARLPCD